MSNGKKSDVIDTSAATAMMTALKQHPGMRVKSCHSGLTKKEAEDLRAGGNRTAMEGFINHDIPDHDSLTEKEATARRPRAKDGTAAMFDDAAIVAESALALNKFVHA
jgi:hypothetical protein